MSKITMASNGGEKSDKPLASLKLIHYRHFKNCQKGKLLVLDVDRTLCDFGTNKYTSKNPTIPRPYLYEFLKTVQEHYDLALWSATDINVILAKMDGLDILDNENFKINFILDKTSMTTKSFTCSKTCCKTKSLSVIWDKYRQYNDTNTILVDDLPNNFHFDPKNGLLIKQYEQFMHDVDNDLVHVGNYLVKLAKHCDDFTTVNHSKYEDYDPIKQHDDSVKRKKSKKCKK